MGRLNRSMQAVQQYGWSYRESIVVEGKISWRTKIWRKDHKFSLTCVELEIEVSFES